MIQTRQESPGIYRRAAFICTRYLYAHGIYRGGDLYEYASQEAPSGMGERVLSVSVGGKWVVQDEYEMSLLWGTAADSCQKQCGDMTAPMAIGERPAGCITCMQNSMDEQKKAKTSGGPAREDVPMDEWPEEWAALKALGGCGPGVAVAQGQGVMCVDELLKAAAVQALAPGMSGKI